MKSLVAKLKCRKGQGTIEYAMITVVVIAILGIVFLAGGANPLSTAITAAFNKVSTCVTNPSAC